MGGTFSTTSTIIMREPNDSEGQNGNNDRRGSEEDIETWIKENINENELSYEDFIKQDINHLYIIPIYSSDVKYVENSSYKSIIVLSENKGKIYLPKADKRFGYEYKIINKSKCMWEIFGSSNINSILPGMSITLVSDGINDWW